jgi:hypothetical protein
MELDEGVLFILGKAPAGAVKAFNEWYDEDHVPPRLGVPGILGARRYSDAGLNNTRLAEADTGATALELPDDPAADPNYDRAAYLSYYDLASLDVLNSEGYRGLAATATERERAMQKVCRFDRRVYRSVPLPDIANARDSAICGEFLICVWWSPAGGNDDEDLRWVDTEFIPELMKIPGLLRARRFTRAEGQGPQHLAMFDLESLDTLSDDTYDEVLRSAPAVVEQRSASATRQFRLHRRFDAAGTA